MPSAHEQQGETGREACAPVDDLARVFADGLQRLQIPRRKRPESSAVRRLPHHQRQAGRGWGLGYPRVRGGGVRGLPGLAPEEGLGVRVGQDGAGEVEASEQPRLQPRRGPWRRGPRLRGRWRHPCGRRRSVQAGELAGALHQSAAGAAVGAGAQVARAPRRRLARGPVAQLAPPPIPPRS